MQRTHTLLASAILLATTPAFAADAGTDLDALRAELAQQRALIDAQQKQIDALADAQDATGTAGDGATHVGLYGEVHYNGLREGDPAVGKNNLHAHRVVLLLDHRYDDDLRFFSEIEFENSPDDTEVETELEQFGIAWRVHPRTVLTVGQFLVPVGLLNETHEPDAIYGVERNPVERYVIPSTWWEKGVMAGVDLGAGFRVDLALHNGLRGDINTLGTGDGLRGFRQEFGGARAEDLATTARLKYTAVPGLELGVALQRQDNITQTDDPLTGGKAPATLWEAHAAWTHGALGLRALATGWQIDNDLARTNGTDELAGWYVEPSWKVNEKVGLFARYNRWNTAVNAPGSDDEVQVNAGVNWWIRPRVVLKADVQDTNQPARAGDGFNLGMGLSF